VRYIEWDPVKSGLVVRCRIIAGSLNERVALLPRTDNFWFSRIRSVANSLINSDFADFTVLQV
jgi:hypothetical protein